MREASQEVKGWKTGRLGVHQLAESPEVEYHQAALLLEDEEDHHNIEPIVNSIYV